MSFNPFDINKEFQNNRYLKIKTYISEILTEKNINFTYDICYKYNLNIIKFDFMFRINNKKHLIEVEQKYHSDPKKKRSFSYKDVDKNLYIVRNNYKLLRIHPSQKDNKDEIIKFISLFLTRNHNIFITHKDQIDIIEEGDINLIQ